MPKLCVGDPMDAATHVGPLVTRAQQQRVLNCINAGVSEGATIAAQAPTPTDERLKDGFWVAPTLLTNVKPGMRTEQEEIFGPVTVVIPFATYEEAVEIANGTEFGLVASVYSNDSKKCRKASRDIEAGMFFINNPDAVSGFQNRSNRQRV